MFLCGAGLATVGWLFVGPGRAERAAFRPKVPKPGLRLADEHDVVLRRASSLGYQRVQMGCGKIAA